MSISRVKLVEPTRSRERQQLADAIARHREARDHLDAIVAAQSGVAERSHAAAHEVEEAEQALAGCGKSRWIVISLRLIGYSTFVSH